jgi:hypothetical protein
LVLHCGADPFGGQNPDPFYQAVNRIAEQCEPNHLRAREEAERCREGLSWTDESEACLGQIDDAMVAEVATKAAAAYLIGLAMGQRLNLRAGGGGSSESLFECSGGRGAAPSPHFHAAYQDALATFSFDPVECIGGQLPRKQQRLVEAWAEIHQAELLDNWKRLQSGRPPLKIESLR